MKTRARDDDDDKFEDDAAPPKKKRRADDEDADDEPRSKKSKRAKPKSNVMLWGLLGGGAIALLACCGGGIGGFFLFGSGLGGPNIVGTWEAEDAIKVRYNFRADGTGAIDSFLRVDFTYRQIGNKLTISPTINFGGIKGKAQESHMEVRREGDTLFLREEGKGREMRLRKIP